MKLLLDTCVLYPGLLRHFLLRAAEADLFQPLWSARIFQEWALRADRDGVAAGVEARGTQVLMKARFPKALVSYPIELERRLWLPDPDDIHVLAAAIAGQADAILTFNAVDFPKGELLGHGLKRLSPDEAFLDLLDRHKSAIVAIAESIETEPAGSDLRTKLKRAGLPRLGKALAQ